MNVKLRNLEHEKSATNLKEKKKICRIFNTKKTGIKLKKKVNKTFNMQLPI